MNLVALIFIASCLLSLLLVPAVGRRCRPLGLVDHPDGHRKLHSEPAVLAGGIAVFIVILLVACVTALLEPRIARTFSDNMLFYAGLVSAATVLLVTGIVDDLTGLRGRQKLVGQIISAAILVGSGLVIRKVELFGTVYPLGLLSTPITLLWLLGAINAVNLLDGINGLAATVGITSAAALAIMSQLGGHPAEAVIASALAGSLLGFLRYNFPRATVFLGDAGSMLIGFLVGALSIQSSLKGSGTVLLATPVCLLAIPFFDSGAAIVRRKLTGRSIFSTDRAHLHHCLMDRIGGPAAVGVIATCCGILAVASFSSQLWKNEMVALVSAVAVIAFFVATRIFGYSELRLLTVKLQSLASSLVMMRRNETPCSNQSAIHLQGHRQWNLLWSRLTETANDLDLLRIELDVNAPSLREGYHAKWESHHKASNENIWRLEIPLITLGHRVGHIRIAAERTSDSATVEIERVLSLLDGVEQQLAEMLDEGTKVLRPDLADRAPHAPQVVARLTSTEPCAPR